MKRVGAWLAILAAVLVGQSSPVGAQEVCEYGADYMEHCEDYGDDFGYEDDYDDDLGFEDTFTPVAPRTDRFGRPTPPSGRPTSRLPYVTPTEHDDPVHWVGLAVSIGTGIVGIGAFLGALLAREAWETRRSRRSDS